MDGRYKETSELFFYAFIDPFINAHWDLYAIDYDEDMDSYEYLPNILIINEIEFLVSPKAAKFSKYWMDELSACSNNYQHIMKKGYRSL